MTPSVASFAERLQSAVTDPGTIATAYRQFHSEGEAVALLCSAALEPPGIEEPRGYIQGWWGADKPTPERSAQRILKAADQILKAGTQAKAQS
jgi:hypothetical protein